MVNNTIKSYLKLTKIKVGITFVIIYLLQVNDKDTRVKPKDRALLALLLTLKKHFLSGVKTYSANFDKGFTDKFLLYLTKGPNPVQS